MDYEKFPIAFTQTVNNGFFLQQNPSYRCQYIDSLNYLVRTFKDSVEAIVFPELTLNGQIHFHGFIKVIDQVKFRKAQYLLKKNLGYNYFKLIDNVPKWLEYCSKDVANMSQLLNEELPYVHIEVIRL